jgi:hypothetical protein
MLSKNRFSLCISSMETYEAPTTSSTSSRRSMEDPVSIPSKLHKKQSPSTQDMPAQTRKAYRVTQSYIAGICIPMSRGCSNRSMELEQARFIICTPKNLLSTLASELICTSKHFFLSASRPSNENHYISVPHARLSNDQFA